MQAELEAVVTENVNLDGLAANEDDDIPLGFEATDPGGHKLQSSTMSHEDEHNLENAIAMARLRTQELWRRARREAAAQPRADAIWMDR